MNNLGFLLILLITYSTTGWSQTIDVEAAKKLASEFISQQLPKTSAAPTLESLKVSKSEISTSFQIDTQESLYHIFSIQPKGFIIIAAKPCLTPVLAYSFDYPFPSKLHNSNLKAWLNCYTEQLKTATNTINIQSQEFNKQTNKVLFKNAQPLIQTHWDQGLYYNSQCPTNTPTGCVATAMGQLMYYWKYPDQGNGFHSYVHPVYGTLFADFANTTYHWEQMADSLSGLNNAVATLLYHAGVSVDMDYRTSGSSAYVMPGQSLNQGNAADALKDYFRYKNSLWGAKRSDYTDSLWLLLLQTEIDAGRPVIYAGTGPSGGHCFIVDGYDANGLFHINWGWGGLADGYYSIQALNPAIVGIGGGSGNYSFDQRALLGVEPASPEDVYEPNNAIEQSYMFNFSFSSDSICILSSGATIHSSNDIDYFKIQLDPGFSYKIYPQLFDVFHSNSSQTYSADVSGLYSTDGSNWSEPFDITPISPITLNNGGVFRLQIYPFPLGAQGTYEAQICISRYSLISGLSELESNLSIQVFPNPTSKFIILHSTHPIENPIQIRLLNLLGQQIYTSTWDQDVSMITVPVSEIENGLYFLQFEANGIRHSKYIQITHN